MHRLTVIAPAAVEGKTSVGNGLARAAQAFQQAGLLDRLETAGWSIDTIFSPETVERNDPILNLGAFNAQIASTVHDAMVNELAPVLMGGTCSHLPGMIGGLQQALPASSRLGLLWLDAHGDFNTPATTPSGMLGGMPVATVAGLCHAAWREGAGMTAPLPTSRIMMVDVRNLDPEEEQLIRATDVQVVRLLEPDPLDRIAAFAAGLDALYVHIDADILDISLQPNHPTAEPDGLTVDQTLSVVHAAVASGKVVAFGLVSVNPDEPGGQIALRSGMDLLYGGLQQWLEAERAV